uniref:Uncharacterized protein n=1 Tax=Arundo donax TaxID=35708 RepID=A0A0A9EI70_ARUDO
MSGKWETEKMRATEDYNELKIALFHIGFFLSTGAVFMLLSFPAYPNGSRSFAGRLRWSPSSRPPLSSGGIRWSGPQ